MYSNPSRNFGIGPCIASRGIVRIKSAFLDWSHTSISSFSNRVSTLIYPEKAKSKRNSFPFKLILAEVLLVSVILWLWFRAENGRLGLSLLDS